MWSSARCFVFFLTLSGIVHPSPRSEIVGQAQNLMSRLPVYFEPNVGQFDPNVRFVPVARSTWPGSPTGRWYWFSHGGCRNGPTSQTMCGSRTFRRLYP